jgi:hypothetical protein
MPKFRYFLLCTLLLINLHSLAQNTIVSSQGELEHTSDTFTYHGVPLQQFYGKTTGEIINALKNNAKIVDCDRMLVEWTDSVCGIRVNFKGNSSWDDLNIYFKNSFQYNYLKGTSVCGNSDVLSAIIKCFRVVGHDYCYWRIAPKNE